MASGRRERGGAVGTVGLDDRDDAFRIDPEVGLADAVLDVGEVDRTTVRGKRGAVVDVVHAVHGGGDPRVDLEDHLLGDVEPGLVVADGRGGDQLARLRDAGDLDDGNVDVSVVALPDLLGDVRQVDVDVVHAAFVDPPAAVGSAWYGIRSAIPSTSASMRSVSEATDAPVSRLIRKSPPVARVRRMCSARAGVTAFGVPALAKPLMATVSPGRIHWTAS